MHRFLITVLAITLLLAGSVAAATPQLINYQGTLLDNVGDPVSDDSYNITFAIYDEASGGAQHWSEIQSVTTTNGSFGVLLGSVEPIHDSVFNGPTRYLSITLEGESELDPRMMLVTVPWSFRTSTIDGTTGGAITGGLTIAVDELVDGNALVITNGSGNTTFRAAVDNSGTTVAIWEVGDIKGEFGMAGTKKLELSERGITMFGATISDTVFNVTPQGELQTGSSSGAGNHSIAFGYNNTVSGDTSSITGGSGNINDGLNSFIGAGRTNTISASVFAYRSVICGGIDNRIDGSVADGCGIVSGCGNVIGDPSSLNLFNFIGGGKNDTISGGPFGSVTHSVIGGGEMNAIKGTSNTHSGILGGSGNRITGNVSAIGGGTGNRVYGEGGGILGGVANLIEVGSSFSSILGGWWNKTSGDGSSVAGGGYNHASGDGSFIAGGGGLNLSLIADSNSARGDYSTVLGGSGNYTTGGYGVVAGGKSNEADSLAFAAGYKAKATHANSWVWSDGSIVTRSFASGSFVSRSVGGVAFYTNADTILPTGVYLPAGGGAWQTLSDQNSKENISEVDYGDILEKIDQLPISEWNYKSQDESIRHIGPMAQDFHRLFGVGENDKHLSTLDPDGVALAAIKALLEKSKEVDQLKKDLADLRTLVEQLAQEDR